MISISELFDLIIEAQTVSKLTSVEKLDYVLDKIDLLLPKPLTDSERQVTSEVVEFLVLLAKRRLDLKMFEKKCCVYCPLFYSCSNR
jgi:hypothetical protein